MLLEEWRADARSVISDHRAQMLAKFKELWRQAWRSQDYSHALNIAKEQCKMLGLYAATKTEVTLPQVDPLLASINNMEEADLVGFIEGFDDDASDGAKPAQAGEESAGDSETPAD